ncbi:ER membrane protein complex subunit 8/9 homolog [Tribolium madens]|uniref:ER membrane protein complex subunit 8/9 homolog n=1 Tax=Tribolium madens TaxID=41895 RepID=UPI001CF738BC|nr:ER membrane protein complex subunit 8/9 homolog [Tribolium madens]
MSDITFSAKAYCKIILHAAKYPHCSVNGVLLSKSSAAKSKEIEFVDAVPLFHIALNLTPMAEIALMQIDELASQKGLVISGYYTAFENLRECSFEKASHRISEKLPSNFPSPCLVVVDNCKLGINLDNIALRVAQFIDGSYKPSDTNRICLKPDRTLDICSNLLERNEYELIDFDNHLDNISLDWMNPQLNAEIEDLVGRFN